MHLGEAILPRPEAIALAAAELGRLVDRNAPYYAKAPGWRPDADRPVIEAIRAFDFWWYIPFARADEANKPLMVRVNGITKAVVIEKSL
jgi:hypothetical protein